MVIILMVIGDYSIGGYWWLLINIILVPIGGYYINGCCGYFINVYWWLFSYKPLVVINGYCIINYCWLLYVILQLLMIIIL
jgi:hypothetical protein